MYDRESLMNGDLGDMGTDEDGNPIPFPTEEYEEERGSSKGESTASYETSRASSKLGVVRCHLKATEQVDEKLKIIQVWVSMWA